MRLSEFLNTNINETVVENKSTKLSNLTIGDKVNVCCYTSFGDEGVEKIKDIKIEYDKKTCEKYNVIVLSGKREFDSRDGSALTPPTMYYIEC